MEKMVVKPAPGMKIRMPDNPREFLPTTGAEVERNAFWVRRLRDGDAIEVAKSAVKPSSKKE